MSDIDWPSWTTSEPAPKKPRPGHPHALTDEVQRELLRSLSMGNFLSTACRVAGISRPTLDYWRKKLEEGADDAQVFARFFADFDHVISKAEDDSVAVIKRSTDWRAHAWFLPRRYPKKWGHLRDGDGNPPLEVPSPRDEDGNEIDL